MNRPTDQMKAILEAHAAMHPPPIETLTPELARQVPLPDRAAVAVYGQHFTKRALSPMPMPVGNVEHITIPGPEGNDMLARVYTPKGSAPEEGWPVLLYFHGGGWVLATLDTYDASCRALCEAAQCVVVSLHYRQAPEHPWPAAPEDAFTAYKWLLTHPGNVGGSAGRIAVGGESAGGNLAAVVTLMAREHGLPMPLHQLLVYPATDLDAGTASPSAAENVDAQPLNTSMLHWFYGHYVPEGKDRTDPHISPLYARDLSDLPPATVILAEIDPLRSDGERYARRLETAGVPVTLHTFEGVTHEFFGMVGLVNEANLAVALAARDLRDAFATPVMPIPDFNGQAAVAI